MANTYGRAVCDGMQKLPIHPDHTVHIAPCPTCLFGLNMKGLHHSYACLQIVIL